MTKVDLYAEFRKTTSRSGKVSDQVQIRIKAPKRIFDLDDRKITAVMGEAVAEQIRQNLNLGLRPNGQPVKPITESTQERREKEEEQGQRGGEAEAKYTDKAFRAKVRRNWNRDYKPPRSKNAQGVYKPVAAGPPGVLSGLLRDGIRVVLLKDGALNLAPANRSKPRPGEVKSAVETVFGDRIWDALASMQKRASDARSAAMTGIMGTGSKKILGELKRMLGNVKELAEDVEDIGDTGND